MYTLGRDFDPRSTCKSQLAVLAGACVIVAAYGQWYCTSSFPTIPGWPGHPIRIWQQAQVLWNTPVVPSISIAHGQPLIALGAPLAALLSLVCSTIICGDRYRARQLLRIVAWSGTFYALLGIVQFVIDPTQLLWREKIAYSGSLTGTFINRNTAAVYFGACGTVCLVLLLHRIQSLRLSGALLEI